MSIAVIDRGKTGKTIPHPRWRLPFLGDLLQLSLTSPTQRALAHHRRLGHLFEIKVLEVRIVFVSDPDIVAELSDEHRFAKHLIPNVAALRELGGDGLFTAFNDEPNWRKAHDLLRPAFTQAAMRSYHETMVDVSHELLAHWDGHVDGSPVDVSSDMTKLTLETIGRTGFSFSFDPFGREKPHPFVDAMAGALKYGQLATARHAPVVGRFLRQADERNRARLEYLNSVIADVIDTRRDEGHTGRDDLLELMMRAAREADPNRLNEQNIRYQIITFLIAGHETTSGALSFALYYLACNPDVLARAQQEVDEVWGTDDLPRPAFEQIAKLRYVRRVLDESLRIWPTVPGYAREAREDTVLADGREMKRGDWMFVLAPGLHRAPEAWGPDPDVFDPDRFLPANVKARPAHVYKPFGTGERACIGRQFALHESVLVLGSILHRYDLVADPAYRLRVKERLTIMPDGFELELRRR